MALGGKLPGAFRFNMVKSFVPLPLATTSRSLGATVCFDRQAFAAKVRLVRAVLGWSQSELGRRVGLTQRAIHKLEQGNTEPRRATVRALEAIWHEQKIEFEDQADGGFQVNISARVFARGPQSKSRRTQN